MKKFVRIPDGVDLLSRHRIPSYSRPSIPTLYPPTISTVFSLSPSLSFSLLSLRFTLLSSGHHKSVFMCVRKNGHRTTINASYIIRISRRAQPQEPDSHYSRGEHIKWSRRRRQRQLARALFLFPQPPPHNQPIYCLTALYEYLYVYICIYIYLHNTYPERCPFNVIRQPPDGFR